MTNEMVPIPFDTDLHPINAVVNIEPRCNSRCLYCHSWEQGLIPSPDIDPWLPIIPQFADIGVKEVVFSGGEPLMNDRLEEVVRSVSSFRMRAHVITNGILFTESRAQRLIEAGAAGITLSMDSLDPEIYQTLRGIPIQRALNALEVLEKVKQSNDRLYCSINCVVSHFNLSDLNGLVDEASRRNLFIAFQAYTWPIGQGIDFLIPDPEEEADLMRKIEALVTKKRDGAPIVSSVNYLRGIPEFLCRRALPEEFHCYAATVGINVDGNRQLHPCWMMEPAGSLDEIPLKTLWHSDLFHAVRDRMINLDCDGCWLQCHTDLDGIYHKGRL